MNELIKELERLGCRTDDYTIKVEDAGEGDVALSDDCTDEIFEVDAGDLTTLLRRLPEGSPIEEGEDYSVWEVIITLAQEGRFSASRYLDGMPQG